MLVSLFNVGIINDQTKNKESEMFNDDLDITEVSYDGEELKIIISNVILSNSVNKDHIVKVNYNGSTYSTTQQLNELIIKFLVLSFEPSSITIISKRG